MSDDRKDMSVPGYHDPGTLVSIPPGLMHRDEANFMAADRRGEPRNLLPYGVAIAALIVIIVLCIT